MVKNKKNKRTDYGLIGSSGEFIVASELSRRGIIATLTLKNTPLIDIIGTNPRSGLSVNIQVKTRSQQNKQGWILSKKVENYCKIKNLFYVFVNFNELSELPEYYIIPHNVFSKFISKNHKKWLLGKDKNGKKRKNNNIRNFKPSSRDVKFGEKFKKWEILNIF